MSFFFFLDLLKKDENLDPDDDEMFADLDGWMDFLILSICG